MSLWTRARNRFQRDASRWFGRSLVSIAPASAIVSFSFDDFPRSALHEGGAILRAAGYAGTYYASFGLMGQMTPTGEIFSRADLAELLRQGHELGCHTYDHCDSWETPPAEFEASILRNQRAVAELEPAATLCTLSYPISPPRPQTKKNVSRRYPCARAGGQTFNLGNTDSRLLKAFFIEQSKGDLDQIAKVIGANTRERGWLILATHDVCEKPTRFGCTPEFFQSIVQCVVSSKVRVLPVSRAFAEATAIAHPFGATGAEAPAV